jgi:hypothetical protein
MSKPLIVFAISLICLCAVAHADDDLAGQIKNLNTASCKRRYQNAADMKSTYENPREQVRAAQDCKKAVEESYNACAMTPDMKKIGDVGGEESVEKTPEKLKEKSVMGEVMNRQKAKECGEKREDAKKACDDSKAHLKQAFDDNSRAERQARQEAESSPGNAALIEQIQRYHETSVQLQDQMKNTDEFSKVGQRSIDDYGNCFASEAARNQIITDYSDRMIEAAHSSDIVAVSDSSSEIKPEPISALSKEARTPLTDTAKDTDACSADPGLCSTAKRQAITTGGIQTLKTGAGVMMTTAEAASPSLLGRVGGLILANPITGAATAFFSSTNPAGNKCDGAYFGSPLAADTAGCSIAASTAQGYLGGR